MRIFHVSEIFFKSIAAKGKLYSRFWFYWLGEHADELMDADFIEKEQGKYKNVPASEIREIYNFGVQLLQQDFKIIEPKKKARAPISKEHKDIAQKVIQYLNSTAGTTFELRGMVNLSVIDARIKDGYTISDFMVVVDKKVKDWKGTDWAKYLRPETLFGNRFHNYLNGIDESGSRNNFDTFTESISKARDIIRLRPD